MGLTHKRRVFIEEYLTCWNGAEAARRAGYKFPRRQASYLLTIPAIRNVVEERISDLEIEDKGLLPSKKVRRKACFVYLIQAENGLVKIGKTINLQDRFKTIDSLSPISLRLLAAIETKFADEIEDGLHARFEHLRIRGEWFALSGTDIIEIYNEWQTD